MSRKDFVRTVMIPISSRAVYCRTDILIWPTVKTVKKLINILANNSNCLWISSTSDFRSSLIQDNVQFASIRFQRIIIFASFDDFLLVGRNWWEDNEPSKWLREIHCACACACTVTVIPLNNDWMRLTFSNSCSKKQSQLVNDDLHRIIVLIR